MYTLLVVDDEEDIRRGMIESINWQGWGYQVIGEAENGLMAKEIIDENPPDIVLSDIKMPGMDGVELMRYVHENYPEIKIVVLSGYNDFKYLDVSIKNRVSAYLLKPTDIFEFEDTFLKLKKTLDEEQEREIKNKKRLWYARTLYLSNLLNGIEEYEYDLSIQAEDIDIAMDLQASRVVSAYGLNEEWEDNKMTGKRQQIIAALNSYINDAEACSGIFILDAFYTIAGIMNADSSYYKGEIQKMLQYVLNETGIILVLGISEVCSDTNNMAGYYVQAKEALAYADKRKSVCLYSYKKDDRLKRSIILPEISAINSAIIRLDPDRLRQLNRDFFRQLREGHYSMGDIGAACVKFFIMISDCANKLGFSVFLVGEDENKCLGKLYSTGEVIEKENIIERYVDELEVRFLVKTHEFSSDKLIMDIYDYIDSHYSEEQLSLNSVAEYVSRTPTYISKIFKERSGIGFIQYVRKKRMEKSLELLQEERLHVYEVAELVGYPDVTTFVKIFKKYHGVTPAGYQKMSVNDE